MDLVSSLGKGHMKSINSYLAMHRTFLSLRHNSELAAYHRVTSVGRPAEVLDERSHLRSHSLHLGYLPLYP